jgi:type IV secretion system protein VirB1
MAHNESGGDTLAIHDNRSGRTYRPQDATEAISIARILLAKPDASTDLGLMQINSRNLSWLGLTIETAFDGCASVRAASTHLTHVSEYNSGSPTRGFQNGYVARFIASRQNTLTDSPPAPVVPTAPTQPAPHVWHDDRDRQPEDPAPRGRHEWHEASQSIKQIEAVNEH